MKNWKALIAGFLALCLVPTLAYIPIYAEESGEEEAEEDPLPDSYYYEIESNNITDWPQGPMIEAAAAAVMDLDTGTFLYSKNATATMYPASITKIMTTLLLIENCDLDDEITFSEIVYDLEEGSSHLGIQPGETMTLRQAAYGIMLASANDIANGVAEYIGGSLSGFADLMNEKAAELGCVNTHFANPHGLYQEDHYTCAYDMALIAQAAYENETFREIVGTTYYTIPVTNLTEEERYFTNHHQMLQSDSEYYQEWCTGGKTGYTSDCLNTLVTYAEKDGMRLVSIILRVNGAGKAYLESTEILEYGFENFFTDTSDENGSGSTFYDIMGLRYLGTASRFFSSAWLRSPMAECGRSITLPVTASADRLSYHASPQEDGSGVVSYEYNGVSVGTASGMFRSILVPAQLAFERDVEVRTVRTVSSGSHIQIESLDEVLIQTTEIFNTGYRIISEYTEEHFMTVFIAGVIVLALLIVLIIVMIFRGTSEARIRRRRKQEEEERRRREEEIDKMTTAEIEAELRAVMEQERLERERELLAQAEAERAAEEARIMEEKAHETERLIDELEKERRERLTRQEATNEKGLYE